MRVLNWFGVARMVLAVLLVASFTLPTIAAETPAPWDVTQTRGETRDIDFASRGLTFLRI